MHQFQFGPGVAVLRQADRGSFLQFEVMLEVSSAEHALVALLTKLPIGGEFVVLEPGGCECYRECRKGHGSFQVARGCHGAAGTWRAATEEEANAWLLPGVLLSSANPRREQAILRLPKRVA